MPFLSDIVGQETNLIKNTVRGAVNSVKDAPKILVNDIKNQVANAGASIVNRGLNAVVGGAIGAVTNLVTGNVAGALESLNPATLASEAFSGVLGMSGSNLSLTDPGYSAAISSSGGINPGDALNGALARPDPMLSFLWYCQLPVIGAPVGANGAGVDSASNALNSLVSGLLGRSSLASSMGGSQTGAMSSQLPWYYVEEANAPFRTFQEISVFRDGRKRHYPSTYTVNPLTLGFYTDVDNNAMQYIQAWNNTILQPYSASTLNTAGGFGRASGYKYPIYLFLIDPMKSVLLTLEYTECWPTSVQDYALTSQNGNERLVTHVTFSVGDVFVNLSQVPGSITSSIVNNALTNAATGLINQGISTAAQSIINFL